jgi:hypothetical protein
MVSEGVLPSPRLWHSRKIWLVAEVEAYLNEWPTDGEEPQAISSDWLARLDNPKEADTSLRPDPLQEHYDSIGFDPKTMNQDDYRRLHSEAHARWIASIPNQPINKLEMRSLRQLADYGVGVFAPANNVKGCGPDTQERLEARGFIEVQFQAGHPDRIGGYILTKKGLDFIQTQGVRAS